MTIMTETPDKMTEIRIAQQETAQALAELLRLDLPPVSWEINDLAWQQGELGGSIRRFATLETFDVAAQEIALSKWAKHFGVTAVPRWFAQYEPIRTERSVALRFSFRNVRVVIYASVPARAGEEDQQTPESAA